MYEHSGRCRCRRANWGAPGAGRVVKRPEEDKVKVNVPPDMATIIKRLRVSLPIMRSTRVDTDMRRLMMATLMQQSHDEGDSVVLPDDLRV